MKEGKGRKEKEKQMNKDASRDDDFSFWHAFLALMCLSNRTSGEMLHTTRFIFGREPKDTRWCCKKKKMPRTSCKM